MAVIGASAEQPRRRGPFYTQLYFQVVFAIIAGGVLGYYYPKAPWVAEYLNPLGLGFVKLVKMIIAPVIFLTIVVGIANMRDLGKLGRVALKAFAYFLFFSTLALVVGLIVGNVFQPGAGMNIDPASLDPAQLQRVQGYQQQSHDLTIVGFLTNIIPDTFAGAFTSGNILQVLFLSIVFGIAMAMVGDHAKPALDVLTSISAVVFKLVAILMRAAPIGAFGAFAFLISSQGIDSIIQLIQLIIAASKNEIKRPPRLRMVLSAREAI
jgi:aerobic C4-dicarboxylate transport protein